MAEAMFARHGVAGTWEVSTVAWSGESYLCDAVTLQFAWRWTTPAELVGARRELVAAPV